MGMIRRPWWSEANGWYLARMPGLHPYSFSKDILGFLMTTENQDLWFNISSKDGDFYSIVSLHWGVRTHTDYRVSTPAGLTNTSSSRNLVFPGGLPSRSWPAQPCLASVGNRSWAAGWYGCWLLHWQATQGHHVAGRFSKNCLFLWI